MASAQSMPEPTGVTVNRDLSRLERALSYTTPIETYLRFLLTTLWMFYWAAPAILAVLVTLNVTEWFGAQSRGQEAEVLRSMNIGVVSNLIFFIAAANAVIAYSKRWSALAVITLCYLAYDALRAVPVAVQIDGTLPKAALHLGMATVLQFVMYLGYFGCLWSILRIPRDEGELCASTHKFRFFPRRMLRPLTVVPAAIALVFSRRLWTTILIIFGASFLFVIPYNLDRSASAAAKSLRKAVTDCEKSQNRRACIEEKTASDFYVFAIGIPFAVLLCVPTGRKLMIAGGRRITWSLEDLARTDLARPVLFLRSFRQDRKPVKSVRSWLPGRIIMLGQPPRTLDQMVLEETSEVGPLIALGDPTNDAPRFGAAKGKLGTRNWHDVVAELIDRAQIVVVFLDETDGVRWELGQIALRGNYDKYLFLVPPSHMGSEDNRRLTSKALETLQSSLAAAETKPPVVGFFNRNGSWYVGRSNEFTTASFLLMIRWFLRTKVTRSAELRA